MTLNGLKLSFLLIVCSLMACSPGTSDLTGSQAYIENIVAPIDRVLVVGISDNGPVRNLFEHEVEKNLEKHGIDAIRSLEELDRDETINREAFVKHFSDKEIDAIIVSQVIDREKLPTYTEAPSGPNPRGAITTWYDYYYQSYASTANDGHYEIADLLVLDSKMFMVQNESLIWDCQSKSFAKDNTEKVIEELGKLLINALIEDGVINK